MKRSPIASSMITLAAVLASASCSSTPEPVTGHEARQELVSLVEEAEDELQRTREQINATLDRYNFLMSRSGSDPVAAYEDFSRSLERTEGRVDSLGDFLDDMEDSSAGYFSAWEKDFDQFSDEALKRRSQERLHGCRKRYGGIRTAMSPARARTDQFLENLNDQMLFLRYDISPAAVKFLQRDAVMLNRTGKQLLASLDEAILASGRFVDSMSAQPTSAGKAGAEEPEAAPQKKSASSKSTRPSKSSSSSRRKSSAPRSSSGGD